MVIQTIVGLILGLILIPVGVAILSKIDDKLSGRHYKSDAEKTEADRHAEREHDDELHRIMWE
jgi:hypothetical protein